MANEFKHADVGDDLSKADWLGTASHVADSQAAGDIIYCDGTYWKRLAKGTSGLYLKIGASAPEWANPLAALTEQGDIAYASAAGVLAALAHGVAGQALLSGGHGANPSWGHALKSKVITSTRAGNAASADVSYTGVGFTPSSIIALAVQNSIFGSIVFSCTWGYVDSAKAGFCVNMMGDGGFGLDYFLRIYNPANNPDGYQSAVVKTFDSDGFTLTWTYVAPSTSTVPASNLKFLCLA